MDRPKTVQEFMDSLPEDRKEPIEKLRQTVLANLNPGFEEMITYGMLGYVIPHSIYPAGYHCDPKLPLGFLNIGNFKGHIGFYPFCIYGDDGMKSWFEGEFKKTGYKLDMGKGCIRLKKMDGIPYEVLGELVKRTTVEGFIQNYEKVLHSRE